VIDYGKDYPSGKSRSLAQVSYAELKSGKIQINGESIPTVPLSSVTRAREIAETLKSWIIDGQFLLGEPQMLLPS
jgi:L-aspartate semialdehyde sulfurtransferase